MICQKSTHITYVTVNTTVQVLTWRYAAILFDYLPLYNITELPMWLYILYCSNMSLQQPLFMSVMSDYFHSMFSQLCLIDTLLYHASLFLTCSLKGHSCPICCFGAGLCFAIHCTLNMALLCFFYNTVLSMFMLSQQTICITIVCKRVPPNTKCLLHLHKAETSLLYCQMLENHA